MSNITNLPSGDHRIGEFYGDLYDFIKSRGDGLSFTAILGAIELAKAILIQEQREKVL